MCFINEMGCHVNKDREATLSVGWTKAKRVQGGDGGPYPRSCACSAGSWWACERHGPGNSGWSEAAEAWWAATGKGWERGSGRRWRGWGWETAKWTVSGRRVEASRAAAGEKGAAGRWWNPGAGERRCRTSGRSSPRFCFAWWSWRTVSVLVSGATHTHTHTHTLTETERERGYTIINTR